MATVFVKWLILHCSEPWSWVTDAWSCSIHVCLAAESVISNDVWVCDGAAEPRSGGADVTNDGRSTTDTDDASTRVCRTDASMTLLYYNVSQLFSFKPDTENTANFDAVSSKHVTFDEVQFF